MAITPLKVIQDHQGRYQSKALLVINSNWHLVSFRSYRSLLFKFWTLRLWATLWGGLRDNVRCSFWARWKARNVLPISVN